MQTEGEFVVIRGKMPVGEMFGLSNELRSGTEGRASFYVVDQKFERLPDELQARITQIIRSRKGLKDEVVEEQ